VGDLKNPAFNYLAPISFARLFANRPFPEPGIPDTKIKEMGWPLFLFNFDNIYSKEFFNYSDFCLF
jgi:hypothetical protein